MYGECEVSVALSLSPGDKQWSEEEEEKIDRTWLTEGEREREVKTWRERGKEKESSERRNAEIIEATLMTERL